MKTSTLVTAAVVLALIVGAYFYGRLGRTEDFDAIVEKHEAVLADTVKKLDAHRDSLLAAVDTAEARVDTLVVRERELVSAADQWAREGARTATQLRAHLAASNDSIGVSVLDNLVAQQRHVVSSLRGALAAADSARATLRVAVTDLRSALAATEEKFLASERARRAIVDELRKRDRLKTLKNVVKVGVGALGVFGFCRLAPEDVC